ADMLLDKDEPFLYNQAMMDVGALICTPKAPLCNQCPLALVCKGKVAPERYPQPKAKKVERVRRKAIIVFKNNAGEFYIYRRTTRFLHGLYGFFEYETLPAYYKENSTLI